MSSKMGFDLWNEIIASAEEEEEQQKNNAEVVYRRRKPQQTNKDVILNRVRSSEANRLSLVAAKNEKNRVSWNRSLSTRGRTSIAIGACMDIRPQQNQARRKGKPALPKGKVVQPANFDKERKYFQEVDAFDLLEESPSPKHASTWTRGQNEDVLMPHLCSRLEKILISLKLNRGCGPSSSLFKLLKTPNMTLQPIRTFDFSGLRTPEEFALLSTPAINSTQSRFEKILVEGDVLEKDGNSQKGCTTSVCVKDEDCEVIENAVKKLSLASTSASSSLHHVDPFDTLLAVCGLSTPSKLLDVLSNYCDLKSISKIGEGTYGEAFKIGNTVCKIVPIDGDLKVNGEVQKKSEELLEEVVLSRTLNLLRREDGDAYNACTLFIETIDLKVCQGLYDPVLIEAWECWDDQHVSENDHPRAFPDNQCYVVFVLQHGGKDLESFVLLNFDEARSLLVQVTAALAVAEAAYEFEHRDLHWGNVLLCRNDSTSLPFILEGKHMIIRTFGLSISIIDFTLSRMNTGEDILFLDLSSDPYLFKGPKGDRQSETYRKMKDVTEDCWEGSFPRTNVLWLLYLIDILLLKKSFERSSKNERDMRSLKKRLDKYQSAKEAIFDPFFSDLLEDVAVVELE
ncbi:serine/threonine-protein kinase haspin homolog [Mangifera indica]|uniref:serine/threonine-protein kinase haspin homolog n=1 Tax=Mangifera indica TaxID=29780 RepID=UPI001CFB6B87|nr:serine/threonine-protein kinase haspin homolog [Mangifera indica]